MYKNFFKRAIDFTLALTALLLLSWLLIIVAVLLHFFNQGAGIFFQQPRPGKGGKVFNVIKFKTMNDKRDEQGNLLPDMLRITKFGNFIRKSSIDELPQLFNVLKGDMSLIGPRPLLVEYLPLYSPEQARRHEVRPGISGWAQVNGRNNISWGEKFQYDVWYVDNLSFMLDLKIVFITIKKVLMRADINNSQAAAANMTEEKFNGHN